MSDSSDTAFVPGAPLYREVGRKMARSIHLGEWKPGEALPAERKLSDRYGVSMGTLRKAVDDLVAKGVLIRQQGRGTFVSKHGKDRYLFAFFHILRQDGRKEYPSVQLHGFSKAKADPETAKLLGVAPGSGLVRIVNLLSLQGRQVIVDEISLPESLFPAINRHAVLERSGTLYELYQDEFGATVIRTEERLRAVKADAQKASFLGVRVGDPLLHVIRIARSFNNQAVELRHSYINTNNYEYYAELLGIS
jgi:GntR family transcriptional regulator